MKGIALNCGSVDQSRNFLPLCMQLVCEITWIFSHLISFGLMLGNHNNIVNQLAQSLVLYRTYRLLQMSMVMHSTFHTIFKHICNKDHKKKSNVFVSVNVLVTKQHNITSLINIYGKGFPGLAYMYIRRHLLEKLDHRTFLRLFFSTVGGGIKKTPSSSPRHGSSEKTITIH